MRNYSWIFDENGKVRKGLECVLNIEIHDLWNDWDDEEQKVVKLAGYRPYYTDGSPDPNNDEVNDFCWIEIEGDVDELQVAVDHLFPLDKFDEPRDVLYGGYEANYIGTAADGKYHVIEYGYGTKVVEEDDIDDIRSISELSEDECLKLAKEVRRGSIYLSDYNNSLCIPPREVSAAADGYYMGYHSIYGDTEDNDTVENFADYLYNNY